MTSGDLSGKQIALFELAEWGFSGMDIAGRVSAARIEADNDYLGYFICQEDAAEGTYEV